MTDTQCDHAYFQRRADEEALAARQAGDDNARDAHLELARRYAAAANGEQLDLRVEAPPRGGSPILAPEFRILP